MQLLRWLLFPITILYTLIIWVRNKLYDIGLFKSQTFTVPTIVIGNLAVGGAGKSPLTQKLINHFQQHHTVASLSRGYGRKTKGFRLVSVEDHVKDVGDEPLQFKKNHPHITVAVDENRAEGIKILSKEHNLIVLDDAFQHRKVTPSCSILLFEFLSILNPILLLPTGNYRDTFDQTKRADLILITKCPEQLKQEQVAQIERKIRRYNTQAPIYYSKISYLPPVPLQTDSDFTTQEWPKDILLITGIANPDPLVDYLKSKGSRVKHLKFGDHHAFDEFDYKQIKKLYTFLKDKGTVVMTTEKDAQRLDLDYLPGIPVFYIPIEVTLEQEEEFLQKIAGFIS